MVYWDNTNSEPSASSSAGKKHNPTSIQIDGKFIDQKTGINGFEFPYMYFSIFPNTTTNTRITPMLRKGNTVKKSTVSNSAIMEMLSAEFKKEGGIGVKELD